MSEETRKLRTALVERRAEAEALNKVRRYMRGLHDPTYMPESHESEFSGFRQVAVGNWLPLVTTTVAQNLFVEGYRRDADPDNLAVWEYWTLNGFDSRQSHVYRSALTYGMAFVLVLPGSPGPVGRVYSPLAMHVVQDDPDAEFPDYAIRRVRRAKNAVGVEGTVWDLIDDYAVWTYWVPDHSDDESEWELWDGEEHGFDVCPVAVFRNQWCDDPEVRIAELGEVWPLIPLQDRLNDTTLGLLIAQQYAAFKQKWATGIEIPRDPETGRPVEPFKAAVNRLWATSSTEARFGEFTETDLSGYLASQESAIKHMAAIAQVPPHYLLGGLVNISAEALAAAEAGLSRKVAERKTLFGEAWGRVFRLMAYAAGNFREAEDTTARVIWRDTEARSLAASADALGKLATMLQVPVEALWEMIPGVTPFQIRRWRRLRESDVANDVSAVAAALLTGDDRGLPTGTTPPPLAAEDEGTAEDEGAV